MGVKLDTNDSHYSWTIVVIFQKNHHKTVSIKAVDDWLITTASPCGKTTTIGSDAFHQNHSMIKLFGLLLRMIATGDLF